MPQRLLTLPGAAELPLQNPELPAQSHVADSMVHDLDHSHSCRDRSGHRLRSIGPNMGHALTDGLLRFLAHTEPLPVGRELCGRW